MALFQMEANNISMWAELCRMNGGQYQISGESKSIIWPETVTAKARKKATKKSWIWNLIIQDGSDCPKSAIDEAIYQPL